jgi:hypothetical protein
MILRNLSFLVLASGMALAQANPPASSTVADELKAMRDAIAAQQQQITQQQLQISEQRQQIVQQQQQIQDLKTTVGERASGTAHVENAAIRTNAPADTVAVASDAPAQDEKLKESPLSFRIGGADFTPGGFVDFENVFRSTNTGNAAATSYGAIPFSNSVAGHLTEYRITGQYSRFNLKTTAKYGANDITGYIEFDFNGNDANNVFVTTNPHTDRLRLYWLDLKRGQWEFLGGQTWGLLTPNRVGLSPMPSDKFGTIGEDANVHVGVNHSRAGAFMAIWHPNTNFAWGFGVENPQQYNSGEVIVPQGNGFPAQLAAQFDTGSAATGVPGTPNAAPDFNTKLAWDSDPSGRHLHFEFGGMLTTVKITNLSAGAFTHHAKMGGGVQAALFYELIPKKLRFIADGLMGNGVGRYLIGLAPQAVVVPNATGTDLNLSLVHSGNALAGFEMQPGKNTQFGFYYGGMYAQRNFFPDFSVAPNAAGLRPNIGFGFPNVLNAAGTQVFAGSGNNNNRAIQEGTIDWTQTFWRNPQYGAVLLVTQVSYLTRAPWFVAAGAPKNAHLTMGYVSLRYVLP